MKIFFAVIGILFLAAASVETDSLIFLCKPKSFASPKVPLGYNIVGISAKTIGYNLGDTSSMYCYFEFYRKNPEDTTKLVVVETQNDFIPAKVSTPQGQRYLHKMLFSGDKYDIYNAASLFATYKGYELLPIDKQTYLNSRY